MCGEINIDYDKITALRLAILYFNKQEYALSTKYFELLKIKNGETEEIKSYMQKIKNLTPSYLEL